MISIITATYNSEATLRDTLNSIILQSYSDYEVIIKDGGSTDHTKEIVDEYAKILGDRLKWVSDKDNGIYDAMNKGIAIASGDVVGILNSDDFYADSNVLQAIAKNIEGVEAVYGDLDFVDWEDTSHVVRVWRGSQYMPNGFRKGWHPAHPTFYTRKECFEKYGKFDISYEVSADFELMLRFIERYGIKTTYVPKVFVKMRRGGESTGSIGKIIKGNRNVLRAFKENGFKVPHFYTIRRLAPKAFDLIKHKLRLTSASSQSAMCSGAAILAER